MPTIRTGYLNGNRGIRVVFRRDGNLKLSMFTGADYTNRCNHRLSISGVAVMLRNTVSVAQRSALGDTS